MPDTPPCPPAAALTASGVTPWWLPDGNAQTIWAALWARRRIGSPVVFERQRWTTPDGDFIDVDFLEPGPPTPLAPLLVLFHGLEGSSGSHYAQAFASVARERGWGYAVPHFRGCSGAVNLAPRAYHSGDHEEIDWMLRRLRQQHPSRPLLASGVSLGGNALLRWAGEHGSGTCAGLGGGIGIGPGGLGRSRGGHRPRV